MLFLKKKQKTALIFDIGSESVTGAICILDGKKAPLLLATGKKSLSSDSKSGVSTEMLSRAVGELSGEIVKKANAQPAAKGLFHNSFDQVLFTLRLPWYAPETRRVQKKGKHAFAVTRGFIEDILRIEERAVEEKVSTMWDALSRSDMVMIERQPVRVRLNGYDTKNPLQKKTSDLDISIYMCIAPKKLIYELERAVRKHVHSRGVSFHSFSLVFYEAVQRLFPSEKNAILVDVGAYNTEVSLMRHSSLECVKSFASGRKMLEEGIIKKLSLPKDIAESLLSSAVSDALDEATESEIREIKDKVGNEWRDKLLETIDMLLSGKTSPDVLFLASESSSLPFFEALLADSGMRIHAVTDGTFKKEVSFGAGSIADPFISLEALFMHKHQNFLD